jgi:hypothetical protein
LRGNRICVEAFEGGPAEPPRQGSTLAVVVDDSGAVVPEGSAVYRSAGGPGACPLIPDASRADPSAADD